MRANLPWGRLLLACLLVCFSSEHVWAQRRGRDRDKRERKAKAPRADIILNTGKVIEDVEIREEKFKAIRYKEKGRSSSTIPGDRVEEIRYLDPHPSFLSGQSQYRAGLYDKAAASFTAARTASEKGTPDWMHSTLWLGEAQLLAGKHEEAEKAFLDVIEADAEHFLVPNAHYGAGRAQTGMSSYTKAKASFQKIDEGFGKYWSALGQLGIGDAALKQNKPSEARKAFKFAEDRAMTLPDLRRAAQVGQGRSFIADKRFDDAVQHFNAIISEPGVAPGVAAGAWVGKGDCLLAEAQAKSSDKNLLKSALIAYLTCVVRYAGIPEAYPKALYQANVLYGMLGLEDQAALMRKELQSRCPSSPWTEKLGN